MISGTSAIDPTRRPLGTLRCLVIELANEVILIEVGLGLFDWLAPARRLGLRAAVQLQHTKSRKKSARQSLEYRGISPDRVTDIVVTHSHPDNLGGLSDFPDARIHANHAVDLEALSTRRRHLRSVLPPLRNWVCPKAPKSTWNGFATSRLAIASLALEFVDLPGHTPEHAGVLLRTADGDVLHLGDAVASLDDLVDPSNSTRRSGDWGKLLQPRPFETLNTLAKLRRLAQNTSTSTTFIAARGSTSRLCFGGPTYPQIGFL